LIHHFGDRRQKTNFAFCSTNDTRPPRAALGAAGITRGLLVQQENGLLEFSFMRHIPKQEWMGCGVASAAMIAFLSYEDVATHWPEFDAASLRNPGGFCSLLESVSQIRWHLSQCWHPVKKVCEYPFPQWPVAVLIADSVPHSQFEQWIVVRGSIVHDPGHWTAHAVSTYPRRNWLVRWMAEPVRPEELVQSQAQNRRRAVRNALRDLSNADFRLAP
jgi:hypothetical protein